MRKMRNKTSSSKELPMMSKNKTVHSSIKIVLRRYSYHDAAKWDCKKITIDGQLLEGRFVVKRKRGDE